MHTYAVTWVSAECVPATVMVFTLTTTFSRKQSEHLWWWSPDREESHAGDKGAGIDCCPFWFSVGDTPSATVAGPSALSFTFISAAVGKAHLFSWSRRQWVNLYRLQQFALGINKCSCCVTSITSQCAFQADSGAGARVDVREERMYG